MEPRPQRPRPQTPPHGAPPSGGQTPPLAGTDTTQFTPQYPPGQDPAAFVAPPRMDYDYSPLDLQPPGQRRKRQVIAGVIGALVVLAVGALIVAGWMALRDDDDSVTNPPNNRVAELAATATETGEDKAAGVNVDGTPAAPVSIAAPTTNTPPTATSPQAKVFDAGSIRTALPVVESMPGAFSEAGDLPQDLDTVVDALGGGAEVETMLTDNGWQAAMARTFVSDDPASTGTTSIVVSVHAFEDEASAQAALPAYSSILEGYGWTAVEAEQVGDGSKQLAWTDASTGEDAVTMYVVDGQLLYRVFAIGPSGFDSTSNTNYVINQILGS